MPVQVLDTIKKEGRTRMIVMFPVGIEANQTKKFQCGFVEKMRDRPPPSNLNLSDDGHSVENSIYKAGFSTENDKRGGQINGITLKEFDGQVLKRSHIAMHWAPNFSKSDSDGYFNMEDLPKSSENIIERGLYQITKKRSGTTDSVPEINLEGKYIFYEGLRYFKFSSTMTVTKDVELDLLRNDEMTMDSLFTHVMYTLPNGKVSHLKLYDEELDQLEENPITDDASWLAFYNVDKGYGYGCIRLKYDNTNNSENSSITYKPYTKISKSKNNGRYWNRILLGEEDVLVKKGDRYTESNAYLIFQVDQSAPEKAMKYYAERLINPLLVKVETP
ncbi:MAG: hypothetical protein L3J08_07560 [Flavobacteriaceae bacterium]|nr:hypothetical protein [Flavobacteriaceae bacterium]